MNLSDREAALLDETVAQALASGHAALSTLGWHITPQAVALPVLSRIAIDGVLTELKPLLSQSNRRVRVTRFGGVDGDVTEQCPVTTEVCSVLAKIMPALAALSEGQSPCRLHQQTVAHALMYSPKLGENTDKGRVFKMHCDDSDITLAVCVGVEGGWVGADLVYVAPDPTGEGQRSGTPDIDDDAVKTVTHTHAVGVGVVHSGHCAWHKVTPIESGERFTLVVGAMLDDGDEWKENFFADIVHENAKRDQKPATED